MTQFSSGRHAKLTADPEPHIADADWFHGAASFGHRFDLPVVSYDPILRADRVASRFAPRPEFDRPLTNPANPILESVRADAAIVGLDEAVGEHLAELDGFFANSPAEDFGQATVDHARAVLTRLAALA